MPEMMEGMSKKYPMDMKYEGMKVKYVDIEMANNGYIVCYSMMEDKKDGSMEHMGYMDKKMIFGKDEEDAAMEMFMKYKKMEMHMSYSDKMNY